MRILFVNSVCGIRSTGRIVTDLAQTYMDQGHECRIVFGRETVPQQYQAISHRIGTDGDLKVNGLKARFLDNEGFNARRQTKEFIQWANQYNPDVLWLHNLHGYYINIELLFDWIKSRPQMQVKWTLHDCWPFTGHCAHFDYAGCNQWRTHCQKCAMHRRYPASFFVDNSWKNYQRKKQIFCGVNQMTVITPSHWLAGLVKESFLGNYPVEVIHNTIDTSIFKPTPGDFRIRHGLQGKTIVLGVSSVWSKKKGMPDYLRLAEMLDSSYQMVLVGMDPKQIQKMLPQILCIQRTNSRQELAEIYSAADVFVNLTYEDTYPTVNLEAMACGTPCITYRTGGSPESVPPEWVVDQGDLQGVIEKIRGFQAKETI